MHQFSGNIDQLLGFPQETLDKEGIKERRRVAKSNSEGGREGGKDGLLQDVYTEKISDDKADLVKDNFDGPRERERRESGCSSKRNG